MTNYIDQYGRWHVKPVTDENPLPTNNGYIYSFYAQMVGLPVSLKGKVIEDLLLLRTKPLNRHPGVIPPDAVPVSHDEYVGVAGLSNQDNGRADRIITYGKANYWQFCDIPGFTPTPFRKLVIDDVMASYEDLANEENPRTAVIKYPALWPVAFWHRPEQQYFYYRCAGRTPGIVRTIYFVLATLVSIFSREKSSPMLGFKMLKFKKIGPNLLEKGLIKLFDRYGKWKEVCKNYFPEDHPILERVLNL
jgi:hypothetical protein